LRFALELGKKKADCAGDGDDVAGRDVAGGGQTRTSPETGTALLSTMSLLSTTSLALERKKP
jgi:hypothetical protein